MLFWQAKPLQTGQALQYGPMQVLAWANTSAYVMLFPSLVDPVWVGGSPALLCILVRQGGFHKTKEQGMRPVRTALEFGMELAAYEPRMVQEL